MRLNFLYLTALVFVLVSCGAPKQAVIDDSWNDEIINIGYGKVSRGNLAVAVAKVNVRDNEVSGFSNIYDYLRGRVAGLYVGNASAGQTPEIRIRGINSFGSSSEPLILVDGIQRQDIGNIDPSTVESVEVIKDASSSIYGVQGANGVILITLKQ